ncbi:MAG: hypothetical protein AAGL98_07925 [Planctomycetota bacterium]
MASVLDKLPGSKMFLFSTGTVLAYRINCHYYDRQHHVWCSPFASTFSPHFKPEMVLPKSSTPGKLFADYQAAVTNTIDKHCPTKQNHRGRLKTGVEAKKKEGVIDDREANEIRQLIDDSVASDFEPVLYVIAIDQLRLKPNPLQVPAASIRAHGLSPEYLIPQLTEDCFDLVAARHTVE